MFLPEFVVLTEDWIPEGDIEASEASLIVAPEPVASVLLTHDAGQNRQWLALSIVLQEFRRGKQ